MSEIKDRDRVLLHNGYCCDCGGHLVPGPRDGAAQNFYCNNREDCRAGFSLTFASGHLVDCERIGEVDDEQYRLCARGKRA